MPFGICDWFDVFVLSGPRHILRRTSKFTRKLAISSLGGQKYALSEVVGRILLLKDFRGAFEGVNPGLAGLGDCESLFTNLETRKMVAESDRRAIFRRPAGLGGR